MLTLAFSTKHSLKAVRMAVNCHVEKAPGEVCSLPAHGFTRSLLGFGFTFPVCADPAGSPWLKQRPWRKPVMSPTPASHFYVWPSCSNSDKLVNNVTPFSLLFFTLFLHLSPLLRVSVKSSVNPIVLEERHSFSFFLFFFQLWAAF